MTAYERQLFHQLKYSLSLRNQDFTNQLKVRYPCLTSYELRICVYLKSGLATKELAMMLGISPDSAKKAKHRLRKKLGMLPSDSFESYLMYHRKRTYATAQV